jgi:outer membrane immunogenic protein
MRKIFSAAFVIAAASAFALPASAQDKSFSGVRVEALVGWDNFSAGSRESESKDGVAYGGAIGYDYEINHIVIGAEFELSDSSTSEDVGHVSIPTDTFHVEANRDIYVGARLGYAFSPRFMGYVKAGWSNLQIDASYNPGITGFPITTGSNDSDGFRAGAGLEYRIGHGVYVKGEYRYSHYGSVGQYGVDVDRNQILGGIGYRF